MATFKKLLCCCVSGDVTDLKRIGRPHAASIASAAKQADGKDFKSVKMKADVDLDEENHVDNRPDVVKSHNADDDRESSTPTIPEIEDFEPTNDDDEGPNEKEQSTKSIRSSDNIVPDPVKEKIEAKEHNGSSTSVATAGLTLSFSKPKADSSSEDLLSSHISKCAPVMEEDGMTSSYRKRNSKSGHSLFQIKRHSSSSSPTQAATPPAVDKVLLIKSKSKSDSGSSSSSDTEEGK